MPLTNEQYIELRRGNQAVDFDGHRACLVATVPTSRRF